MKKTSKNILCAFLLLTSHLLMTGQQNSNDHSLKIPKERVHLHLNASLYLSGENLLYSFYCMDLKEQKPSVISKIGYVELIDENLEAVFKQKVKLEQGRGHGVFFIPSAVPSGNYKLIAYTQWMLNGGVSEMYQQDILIVNPFQQDQTRILASDNGSMAIDSMATPVVSYQPKSQGTRQSLHDRPLIDFEESAVGKRQRFDFKVQSPGGSSGSYSISVRKKEGIASPVLQKATESLGKTKDPLPYQPNDQSGTYFLPELRGELIKGKVTTAGTTPAPYVNLALSIPERNFVFKIVQTDAQGNFHFILDQEYEGNKAVIQVIEAHTEKLEIKLQEHSSPDYSQLGFAAHTINEKQAAELLEKSIDVQIQNSYAEAHSDSIRPVPNRDPVFEKDRHEYFLDDYTRFPTVKETILEVVELAYTRQRQNKGSIHTRIYNEEIEKGLNTLLLVDGLFIQDHDPVIHAKAEKIKKISVYNKSYIYGTGLFEGVVSMESYDGDFLGQLPGYESHSFDLFRPEREIILFEKNYEASESGSRIPDQRRQLYWQPEAVLSQKVQVFSFYTSDVEGIFEIVIEGVTESGMLVSSRRTFEVR